MTDTQLWVLLKLLDSGDYFFTYIYYYLKPLLGHVTEEHSTGDPLRREPCRVALAGFKIVLILVLLPGAPMCWDLR